MPGFHVKTQTLVIGDHGYRIRSLLDRTQFCDTDLAAAQRGIPDASWPYFGLVWPAGLLLAQTMSTFDAHGGRILEVGCGLALAGIVSHRRHADVTVSDIHPLAESFLRHNLALNGLPPLPYLDLDWSALQPRLGKFDVIIGSDILYEREHPAQLVRFLERHGTDAVRVLIADPGRRERSRFDTRMRGAGFVCNRADPRPWARMRLSSYQRGGAQG